MTRSPRITRLAKLSRTAAREDRQSTKSGGTDMAQKETLTSPPWSLSPASSAATGLPGGDKRIQDPNITETGRQCRKSRARPLYLTWLQLFKKISPYDTALYLYSLPSLIPAAPALLAHAVWVCHPFWSHLCVECTASVKEQTKLILVRTSLPSSNLVKRSSSNTESIHCSQTLSETLKRAGISERSAGLQKCF